MTFIILKVYIITHDVNQRDQHILLINSYKCLVKFIEVFYLFINDVYNLLNIIL